MKRSIIALLFLAISLTTSSAPIAQDNCNCEQSFDELEGYQNQSSYPYDGGEAITINQIEN